jgi:membrane protease YdiL (CAAX protease family)
MVFMVLSSFAGALLYLIPGFGSLAGSMNPPVALGAFALTAGLTLAAYVLFSVALVRVVDRRPVRALGLAVNGRAVGGLLGGIVLSALVVFVVHGIAGAAGLGRGTPGAESGVDGYPVWFVVIYALLLAFVLQGIGEEVIFRGYLLQSLSTSRPVLAVLVSAAAFAVLHLISNGGQQNLLERFVYLAIPFGFALAAGMLALALRSVWAAVGVHGGFHVANTSAVLLGFDADGPVIWALLGLAFTIAAASVASRIPAARWDQVRQVGPYAQV